MQSLELPSLTDIIRQALRLEPGIYVGIQNAAQGIWIALTVVLLAALSESFGQSIVLFVNRVRPRRFVLALLIATSSRIAGFWLWARTPTISRSSVPARLPDAASGETMW